MRNLGQMGKDTRRQSNAPLGGGGQSRLVVAMAGRIATLMDVDPQIFHVMGFIGSILW